MTLVLFLLYRHVNQATHALPSACRMPRFVRARIHHPDVGKDETSHMTFQFCYVLRMPCGYDGAESCMPSAFLAAAPELPTTSYPLLISPLWETLPSSRTPTSSSWRRLAMHEADCTDADADAEPPLELTAFECGKLEHEHQEHTAVLDILWEHDEECADDDAHATLLRSRERSRSPTPSSAWRDALRIVTETGPTLLLTTIGLLFTGELLNEISHWRAMSEIDELIMIIPVILNLKGNLEMNLSARLGTAANIGELDKPSARRSIVLGNLSLLQVQATIVSFVAALMAFALGRALPSQQAGAADAPGLDLAVLANGTSTLRDRGRREPLRQPRGPGGLNEFVVTASSSMLSTCLSSGLLGCFMCGLVLLCRKIGVDPDNIAPPVAACLGDLVPLVLLGVVSAVNIRCMHTPLPLLIMLALVVAAVCWVMITRRNDHVGHLLWQGWLPLFVAMVISCAAGMVLDIYVGQYEGFAVLAILISGLPGNVGSIVVSRLSTALHANESLADSLPSTSTDTFVESSSRQAAHSRLVKLTLLAVTFPIEVAFLVTLRAVGWLRVPFVFLIVSVVFFGIAVVLSLYLAEAITSLLWKHGLDPDIYALPLHSAVVDLMGLLLLVICFEAVSYIGVPVQTGVDSLM